VKGLCQTTMRIEGIIITPLPALYSEAFSLIVYYSLLKRPLTIIINQLMRVKPLRRFILAVSMTVSPTL